jgi:N-acyl-D-aspartate/D-glutamate deacylase
VLGLYARERGLLRLEDAVRKMTSLNAAKIGLRDRGWLRSDSFADVTIFDEQRITDRATYDEPFQYAEGVEWVIVNGQVVIEKGAHTGVRSGRALRHESRMAKAQGAAASDGSPVKREKPGQLNAGHAGEGPAWHAPPGSLYFTGENRISR